ncbi:MAG: deoxyuridine 5'-triphosphate nucleotidohydrolase [Clostridia bacterium]
MQRIAQFYKVSFEQFAKDWQDTFGECDCKSVYDKLQLPTRATKGSAGYDFFAPIDIELAPNQTAKIPTGMRVRIDQDWVLQCFPRSGLGFKFRLQLNNTVGIIDSDYYNSSNEGHIFLKITNATNEGRVVKVKAGEGFAQGIFVQYGVTCDDCVDSVRDGGLGSTTRK